MRALATGIGTLTFCLLIWVVALAACGSVARSGTPPRHAVDRADAGRAVDATADAGTAAAAPTSAGLQEAAAAELGGSPATAIEVCMPRGETAYLRRLRCADDAAPSFERDGLAGYRRPRAGDQDYRRSAEQVRTARALEDGERDLHPVDRYVVTCGDPDVAGAARGMFFDMYHCEPGGATPIAPPGYRLAIEPSSSSDAAQTAPAPEK